MSKNFGFFKGFSAQRDLDAAMKFSLNCILMEDRIEHLSWLATDGHQFGGVSGAPGWEVERRDSSSSADAGGYESWLEWASFRAYVDPNSYSLAHPEFYMSGEGFYGLLCTALDSYIKSDGLDVAAAKALLDDVHLKSDSWSLGRKAPR